MSSVALVQFPYVDVRGGGRPLKPSRSPSPAVAPVPVVVADDVVGDGAVGELLAVVELVSLAAALAVQHKVSGAVPGPETKRQKKRKRLR